MSKLNPKAFAALTEKIATSISELEDAAGHLSGACSLVHYSGDEMRARELAKVVNEIEMTSKRLQVLERKVLGFVSNACRVCEGRGQLRVAVDREPWSSRTAVEECEECDGSGRRATCDGCGDATAELHEEMGLCPSCWELERQEQVKELNQ